MLWLMLSGMIMSFALLKGGLGAAVTLHFIVNMTA
jgi:membrane protease YdiL (CAAX protease family)